MKWSARFGGMAWTALAALALIGAAPLELISVLFLLAPLVVAPLAFELAGLPRSLSLVQPFAAAAAALSCLVPKGPVAGTLAGAWAALAVMTSLAAFFRLRRALAAGMPELLVTAGLMPVAVGGAMLVAARAGYDVAGFPPVIVLLTAVHFHFTMFATPILAGRAAGAARRPWIRALLLGSGALLLAATPLLAVGFVFSPRLQVTGALAVSLAVAAIGLLQLGALGALRSRAARAFLVVSSAAVLVAMGLSGVYALGEFLRTGWLSIPRMAQTHGILNALGFVLCGLLAWTLEGSPGVTIQRR